MALVTVQVPLAEATIAKLRRLQETISATQLQPLSLAAVARYVMDVGLSDEGVQAYLRAPAPCGGASASKDGAA